MPDSPKDARERRIEIPERTAQQIEDRIDGTEFESVEEYVVVALDRLLWELRRRERSDSQEGEGGPAQDDNLEERLDALGYL